MSDIFLSYKSEDRPRAKIIAEAFDQHGYSVWWDRKIPPGKTFDQVIEEKLNAAKCVIVLWSQQSVLSDWVKEEANEGLQRRILVPILIDDVRIPLGFRRIQAARLVDWQGKLPNPEFDLLLESVSRILGSSTDAKKEEIEVQKEAKGEAVELRDERAKKSTVKRGNKAKSTEKIPKNFTNSIGMKFMFIQEGEFIMGSEEQGSEKPVHRVKINKPFYLGIYPVTQREWKDVLKENPSYFKGDDLPVVSIYRDDIQEFIEQLNEKENTNKYRLPSEAEWEYAARAGTATRYYFGDDESKLGEYAWYDANSGGKTHPVGEKKPNACGLYDMLGNVWEYVQDNWHEDYNGAPADGSAWEDNNFLRMTRGGSWYRGAKRCRSAARGNYDPGRLNAIGFRLLREI